MTLQHFMHSILGRECFNVTVLIQYQPPLVLTTSLMRTGGAETDSRLEFSFFTGVMLKEQKMSQN